MLFFFSLFEDKMVRNVQSLCNNERNLNYYQSMDTLLIIMISMGHKTLDH